MSGYDWESPGATAIVVPFPAAEAVTGAYRRRFTPSGKEGMPAHATILAPFLHRSELASMDPIRVRLGSFRSFAVTFSSYGLFEHISCLWLDPQPPEPFVALSEALLGAYPTIEYPPAPAREITPHVTVGGRLTPEQLDEIKCALEPQLPIHDRAERVVLFERGGDGRWFDRETFALS